MTEAVDCLPTPAPLGYDSTAWPSAPSADAAHDGGIVLAPEYISNEAAVNLDLLYWQLAQMKQR